MAIQKLSARKLESAKPGQTLVDQQNENLELDVSASGKRSWFVRYSCKVMKDGKLVSSRFRKKVGSYPAMSHDEAIEIRNQYMRWIAAGIDPATRINKVTPEKADKNGPLTFGEYADREVPILTAKYKNPKHRAQWLSTLHTYCKPKPIWKMPIADVDEDAVADCIRDIWRTKNETASRLRGRIQKIMASAIAKKKYKGDNPATWELMQFFVRELTPEEKQPRHHPAMDYDRMPKFWRKLAERSGPAADCLRIVILTCLRTSEANGADWSEFDFDRMVWTIPGVRMKLKKEHEVPITEPMMAVLDSIPGDRTGFVFRNPVKGNVLSENAMLALIKRMRGDAMNSKDQRVTAHGFRSTFRDWVEDCTEIDPLLAEAQLAHAKGKVERAYRRQSAVERRREMMTLYGEYVTGQREMTALPSNVHRLAS